MTETDVDFSIYRKIFLTIAVISILFNFYMLYDNINGPSGSDARLERVTYLTEFTTYYYYSPIHNINENMTLANVRDFYVSPAFCTYKDFGATLMLGYLCDGDNEKALKYMLK